MSFFDAADMAAFFDADLGAQAATFTPAGGTPVSCTVIVKRPDETSAVGLGGLSNFNTQVLVRASEIAGEPDGGSFAGAPALAGLTYIVADADLDEVGEIWTCHLRPST